MNTNISPTPPLGNDTPQPKTSSLAVWSLVLGILSVVLSLICIGSIIGIPAIICGHMAYSRIKRSKGQLAGQGLAIAGFTTGYVSLVAILLLLPIAIPNFVKARQTAQMNACISNLRQIDAAENRWAMDNGKTKDDVPTAQDLDPYIKGGFKSLHCPAGGTYTIGPVGQGPTCSIPGHKLPD